jgi:chromosome segregation ATPase
MEKKPATSPGSSNLFHQPFPIPRQCEDMLQDLQQSIIKLDSSFQFTWDSELTFLFASKYLKQAAEAVIRERSQLSSSFRPGESLSNFSNLSGVSERHLLEKEKELNEREKKTQEAVQFLRAEEVRLNQLKKQLEDENVANEQNKKCIDDSFAELLEEKKKIAAQMKILDEKYNLIKSLMVEIDNKKAGLAAENFSDKDLVIRYQDLERQKNEFEKEKEIQINQFLKVEASLKERDNNLELKKGHLQELANNLQNLKIQLTTHHEKITEQMDSQFSQLQEQEKELKEKKLEMDETLEKLSNELSEVEALKQSLQTTQKTIDLSNLPESELREKIASLVEREEKMQKTLEEVLEKEKQLEERSKYFDSVENLKEELDRVQKLYQEMENDFETREIQASAKAHNLDLRERQVSATESSDSKSLLDLNNEIKQNLKKLEEDEAKLLKAQDFVIKEKEELDKSTKMLQNIFQELSIQKKKLMEDQLNLELEKEKFVEVVGKLEEESRNISESEEFVSSKILELQKKELELEQKELELLEREKSLLEKDA